MKPYSISFDLLFDADEHYRSGLGPWTFFAYPSNMADERGLPPDKDACHLLACLQKRGIQVAIWRNGIAKDTSYFACRKEDIHRLADVIQELEEAGVIDKDFCNQRTERLFAAQEKRSTKH